MGARAVPGERFACARPGLARRSTSAVHSAAFNRDHQGNHQECRPESDLAQPLAYQNASGDCRKRFGSLLLHFFNHQTHHRGQATTLLSQAGVDVGVTDLLAWIPED